MNYSTAIFLINPKVRAIKAIYEPDADGKTDHTTKAKREIFKTFDPMVSVGDLLIVPSSTRLEVTTVKVVETDIEVDLETTADIKWVVGIIDMEPFKDVKRLEQQAIDKIKQAEANHRREELRQKLMANVDQGAMATLQIANMGDAGGAPKPQA